MVKKVAFNGTESPVVIDDEGHSLAGLERGEVDTTSDAVKGAIATGQLVWAETDTKGK